MCVIVYRCVQIREELRANGIDVYPQKEFDEDADDRIINDKIRVSSVGSSFKAQLFSIFICKPQLDMLK